jgi:hypothetical protein
MAATKRLAKGLTLSPTSNGQTSASFSAFGKEKFRNTHFAAQNKAFEHGVDMPDFAN